MSGKKNQPGPLGILKADHNSGFNEQDQDELLPAKIAGKIRLLIDEGAAEPEVMDAVVTQARELPEITSATLFFLTEGELSSPDIEVIAQQGSQIIPEPLASKTKSGRFKLSPAVLGEKESPYHYFKIIALGRTCGWLGIHSSQHLSSDSIQHLEELAFLSGIAYERPRVAASLQHRSNKLEVLNELNKLVASDSGLDRIARTVAREAAFRFSAGCSLLILMSEGQDYFEIKGSYGCPPKTLPESVEFQNTLLGRAVKLGGIMSVPDLRIQHDHGLDFLSKLGFSCAHWSSIDIRSEGMGAIIIGFREQKELSEFDGDMFEEFSRGASVAITNAINREKLSKYAGKLEELVEERTKDLEVQTARADEANQAKSRFVANMSHELRTPLTAIVGYSSVVAEGVFGEVNKEQKDALNSIQRAAEHLKELINDVLDVSKVEAGKEDPSPSEVEVFKLMEQVFKLMMQTAMGKGVQLVPVAAAEGEDLTTLKAWVDARHIRQILINLMSNAIKYTPTGGQVSLILEKMGDKAKILVRDTGVGMSEEELSQIFQRYHRVDDSYSRTQVGTGIGLSLTKKLIEMNGGKIGVHSEVGKGSDFWILVPLADDLTGDRKSGIIESEDTLLTTRLDGLNILIVDDNHFTCEVLQTIIKSVGGNPFVAYSVKDAKEIAQATALDTALIDLAIPGENGLDLLDYFRKQCEKPLSSMPLIVVSACVFDSDKKEALKHGASVFVPKPFSPGEIVNTIRTLTTSSVLNPL